MEIIKLSLDGVIIFKPRVFEDTRGYFFESFSQKVFDKAVGGELKFVQDNQSMSHKNAVRGLHFQRNPFAQGKLVSVVRGAVIDLVVDIRKNSSTYGKSLQVKLSEDEISFLWIPPGFAHGFCTLEDHTIFQYKCTNLYHKESEGSVLWSDPKFGFNEIIDNPIVSAKDLVAPKFSEFKSPF